MKFTRILTVIRLSFVFSSKIDGIFDMPCARQAQKFLHDILQKIYFEYQIFYTSYHIPYFLLYFICHSTNYGKYIFHVWSYCVTFQIVGCVGALRLNKRLLKSYWIILLCLLVGDVLVGFIWLFRFDAISKGLDRDLSNRLSTEYRHNIKG